jgi:hypothetical protein
MYGLAFTGAPILVYAIVGACLFVSGLVTTMLGKRK